MTCPSCGSPRVHASRPRSTFEKIRIRLTGKDPYRCHACQWRGWRKRRASPALPDVHPDDLRSGRKNPSVGTSDLDTLDHPPS
jgi:hypothetical protein